MAANLLPFCKAHVIFTLFLISISSQSRAENKPKQRINIILVGATGDLAKRYLWNGFFNLYSSVVHNESDATELRFYGAAREDNETGRKIIIDVLNTSIKCSNAECNKTKTEFIQSCSYQRLKTQNDFQDLQILLEASLTGKDIEIGRIFYLSVPPFAYEKISKNIAEKCRPKSPNVWVRVVLEKPFGSDLRTAKELAEKLSKYWKEDEIYRIDHYLGKPGIAQIVEFKKENKDFFDKMWSRNYIEQVNIVVKERLDAQGRMAFYDEYGVIRDVFQNHLTEILVLLALEMSGHNSEISKKSALLRAVKTVTIHDAVFGQYKEYNAQLKQEVSDIEADSNTPTFAAAVMQIQNKRWAGVPFVLISGKSLDSRNAYVQIQFKQKKFCMKDNLNAESENCKSRQLTFYIQGEHIHYPLTIFSRKLPNIKFSKNWLNLTLDSQVKSHFKGDNMIMKPPNAQHDAYSFLIWEVYLGNREKFVNIDDLLLSWRIWNSLVEASALVQPRVYTQENMDSLDFEIVDGKISFVSDVLRECGTSRSTKYEGVENDQLHSFRGNRLVSGHSMDVVRQLANDIVVAIHRQAQFSSTVFHLALSGGSTSKHLLQVLALMKYIPWENVHIWLVDERCVSFTNEESNFKNMYQYLLHEISIPYLNIHPMPVDFAGELCKPDDLGKKHYESQLRYHLVNGSLDFVVLGVGNDGHTASLFPGSDLLLTSNNWVELTSSLESYNRMTMTLAVLNQAKNIAVLLLGEKKRNIVQKLAQGGNNNHDLPITVVNPLHGLLVWYIDDNALYYS